MRQLVEGADALLNLAAVATSLASQRNLGGGSSRPVNKPHHNHLTSKQRSHHPRHTTSNQSRHSKVQIMNSSQTKLSASKGSDRKSKNKYETLHNNNTIINNNNNKVLKVRRFGSSQGHGTHRHHLSDSHSKNGRILSD